MMPLLSRAQPARPGDIDQGDRHRAAVGGRIVAAIKHAVSAPIYAAGMLSCWGYFFETPSCMCVAWQPFRRS